MRFCVRCGTLWTEVPTQSCMYSSCALYLVVVVVLVVGFAVAGAVWLKNVFFSFCVFSLIFMWRIPKWIPHH